MLIMVHCIFIRGWLKSTFSKYSFGREVVTKKSSRCKLLIMLIIMDDPLASQPSNVDIASPAYGISGQVLLQSLPQ